MKSTIITWVIFCLYVSLLAGCVPENPDRPNPITVFYGQTPSKNIPIPPSVYNQYLVTNITQLITSGGMRLGDYYSFEHEGHLYVVGHNHGFVHSPACQCLKKIEFENKE